MDHFWVCHGARKWAFLSSQVLLLLAMLAGGPQTSCHLLSGKDEAWLVTCTRDLRRSG